MQVPKVSLLICVLAIGASLTVRAEDTPAQAAARAALDAKLKELNAQTPATNTVEAAPVVKNEMCAPATKPAVTLTTPRMHTEMAPTDNEVVMKPIASETAPMVGQKKCQADKAAAEAQARAEAKAQKAAAEAKARQDAAQAAAELRAKKQAQAAAEAQAAADKKAKREADKKIAAQKQAETAAAKAQPKPEKSASNTASTTPATPVVPAPVAAKPSNAAEVNYPGKDLGLNPIAAPPLPITASKEDRLLDLLQKYKANQITPKQYYEQREAILDQP